MKKNGRSNTLQVRFVLAIFILMPAPKTLRTCPKGHRYVKSSSCPTCPVCEAAEKPVDGFMTLLAAPARRALQAAGITALKQLAFYTEEEILQLHGMGKTSIPKLKQALKVEGLRFKKYS